MTLSQSRPPALRVHICQPLSKGAAAGDPFGSRHLWPLETSSLDHPSGPGRAGHGHQQRAAPACSEAPRWPRPPRAALCSQASFLLVLAGVSSKAPERARPSPHTAILARDVDGRFSSGKGLRATGVGLWAVMLRSKQPVVLSDSAARTEPLDRGPALWSWRGRLRRGYVYPGPPPPCFLGGGWCGKGKGARRLHGLGQLLVFCGPCLPHV